MSKTDQDENTLFIPKKRILGVSQKVNQIKKQKSSRMASLEFDMVRIPSDSRPKQPSRIPSLNNNTTSTTNANTRTTNSNDNGLSNIPRPTLPIQQNTSEIRNNPSYNFSSIQALLNKKGPVLRPPTHRSSSSHSNSNLILNPIFDIEYYHDQEVQLDQQLNAKLVEFRNIDNEVSELRRENNKYKLKYDDINMKVMEKSRKLANLEETITSDVSNQEKLINIDIQRFQTKLKNELNEIEFSLKNELKQNNLFKDEEIEKKIEQLQTQVNTLEEELTKSRLTKSNVIESETKQLEDELCKTLGTKQSELIEITKQLEQVEKERVTADERLTGLKLQVKKVQEENFKLESSIMELETTMNNFNDTKKDLLRQITVLEQQLGEVKQQDVYWEQKLKTSSSELETFNHKWNKFESQRRILENSIMNLESKSRVYVKIDNDNDNSNDNYNSNDNEVKLNNMTYQFNKLFTNSDTYETIIDESWLFLQTILQPTTTNISLILSGNDHNQFILTTLIETYKKLVSKSNSLSNTIPGISLNFKSIAINQPYEHILDLLNSNNELSHSIDEEWIIPNIPSQAMKLDYTDIESTTHFLNIISSIIDTTSTDSIHMHIITVNIPRDNIIIENNLIFYDITKLSNQLSLLQKLNDHHWSNTFMDKLMGFMYKQSKCLLISNLSSDSEQVDEWLSVLSTIKKMGNKK
ncbi:uncharacterized protein RJT21DRAFT_118979 [Scheffersomyces amazonensis]|uniref:uncharacterized protein n=1 Tax=Scheffersomyces amazonensis TaxID=1078765 RepID=UPI00315CD088